MDFGAEMDILMSKRICEALVIGVIAFTLFEFWL
jgi:hypothetical protein